MESNRGEPSKRNEIRKSELLSNDNGSNNNSLQCPLSSAQEELDKGIINEFQPEMESLHDVIDIFIPIIVFAVSASIYGKMKSVCHTKIHISSQILSTEYACFIAYSTVFFTIIIQMITLLATNNISKKPLLKLYSASLVVSLVSASSISYHWYGQLKRDVICVDAMG
jgi:hypothetical protein